MLKEAVKRVRQSVQRGKPYNESLLSKHQLRLLDRVFKRHGARSFADLGGVWMVEGGYSFYAVSELGAQNSFLVDTHPTPTVEGLAAEWPQLSLIRGNFGDPEIAAKVKGVDAVLLFGVLLHQVAPDWNEILELYSWAPLLVIYNMQWNGPETVRFLDLGEEEYFRNTPHRPDEPPYDQLFAKLDEPHPDHGGRKWRDVHHIWQWGITDLDLISTADRLGYKLEYFESTERFGSLPQVENRGMIFSKRR